MSIAGTLFNEKHKLFYGRTYLSQDFKLEDDYRPLQSFGINIVDLIYFNSDREWVDSYVVLEFILK